MRDILKDWLAEDVGKGDFTSQAVVQDTNCEAQVTGGPGIVSGIEVVKTLLNMVNVEYQQEHYFLLVMKMTQCLKTN